MYRSNIKSIGDVISDYINESKLDGGLLMVRVFDAWESVMAEQFAPFMSVDEVKKLTLNKFYSKGTLSCKIASSVVRNRLRVHNDRLISKLNSILGGEYVHKLVLS